jgi:hypothetical protein
MNKRILVAGILGLALMAPTFSQAAEAKKTIKQKNMSIKEKERNKAAQTDFDAIAAETNTACGSKIKATIDWATFSGVDAGGNSLPEFCGTPLRQMAGLCATDAGKEGVSQGVKEFVCKFGGPGKRALSEKDGVVTWTMEWEGSSTGKGDSDFAKEWLENNL